jgi:hypothetical protein
MFFHGGGTFSTFGFTGSEYQDSFAVFSDFVADEVVSRMDFEPFGTPSKFLARSGIAFANQVDPKGIFEVRIK